MQQHVAVSDQIEIDPELIFAPLADTVSGKPFGPFTNAQPDAIALVAVLPRGPVTRVPGRT
jgi:hypothetical protein